MKGRKLPRYRCPRAPPLLRTSTGEVPDRIFKSAMTLCGLAVLGVLVLIVYELVSGSRLSWHAFGFKFFAGSDWNPVSEQFGALPFIYGTLVSSLLALIIAVPLAVGVAVFTTEMCPELVAQSAFVLRGIAGRDSERDLRIVGDVCPGAAVERVRSTVSGENPGMDRTV